MDQPAGRRLNRDPRASRATLNSTPRCLIFIDTFRLCRHLDATAAEDGESDRCVWLILDALNEADRFTDLVRALDDLLPALGRHRWLRLAVSLRSGAYQSLAQRHRDLLQHGAEVLANARFLATFTDPKDQEVPYLDLRPFTVEEAGAAYELRRQRRPGQSCPLPHDRLAPSLRELLRAPLYLHLFHETFRGRREPPLELDEGRLLGAYLDRLESDLPGIATHLQRLGRLMFERRIPVLPVAEADAWVTEWRARLGADNALRVVKLDPVEELVAASLLMRPAEEGEGSGRRLTGYGFTQQRLCEQVLLRELRRQIHPRVLPTAEELLAWAGQADGPDTGEGDDFHELTGALETITAELAVAGQGQTLAALLNLAGETVRTRLFGSALRALGPVGRSNIAACEPILAALFERAIAGIQPGKRLYNSVLQAQRWLTEHGFSPVAGRIAQGRLQIMRALVAQEPGRADLRREISVSLNHLGRLAQAAGDGASARRNFEESLDIRRALVAQDPGRADLRRDLAVSLSNLGNLTAAAGDGGGARCYFEESLGIRRALVAQEQGPADLRRDLSVALNNLGNLAAAAGDGAGAWRSLEESLEILRALVVHEPARADLRRDMSVLLNHLGNLAQAAGDGAGAWRSLEESLKILRALVAQEPARADLRRELSVSLNNLGNLAAAAGDGAGARRSLEESLEILRALVVHEPARADLRRDMSVLLNHLGNLAQAAGDGAGARRSLEE
ncbi:tetratricopeptide repeat protein, partial [uncultured Thiodictyon sp.]|uniref:tetratricopeptide repeat protein n=1 Tax=uncultured Thiodictyon sp. TaxID=1846217 RepID=UPI0025DF9C75